MADDLTVNLALALRELLATDPDLPSYAQTVVDAEALVREGGKMTGDLAILLTESLRELLAADPSLPSYDQVLADAEALVSECEQTGIIAPEAD